MRKIGLLLGAIGMFALFSCGVKDECSDVDSIYKQLSGITELAKEAAADDIVTEAEAKKFSAELKAFEALTVELDKKYQNDTTVVATHLKCEAANKKKYDQIRMDCEDALSKLRLCKGAEQIEE